jgi:hypothetical protein
VISVFAFLCYCKTIETKVVISAYGDIITIQTKVVSPYFRILAKKTPMPHDL